MEKDLQFEADIEQLIYVHQHEDSCVKALKKNWGKKGKFIRDIQGLTSQL